MFKIGELKRDEAYNSGILASYFNLKAWIFPVEGLFTSIMLLSSSYLGVDFDTYDFDSDYSVLSNITYLRSSYVTILTSGQSDITEFKSLFYSSFRGLLIESLSSDCS